jgi:hypothetical protein
MVLTKTVCIGFAGSLVFASFSAAAPPQRTGSEADLTTMANQVARSNASREAAQFLPDVSAVVEPVDDSGIWFYLAIAAICGAGFEIIRQCRKQLAGPPGARTAPGGRVIDEEWRRACTRAMAVPLRYGSSGARAIRH